MPNLQGFLLQAIEIYEIAILGRILFSWIQGPHPTNALSRFLYGITEPLLEPIRNLLRNVGGPFDFSAFALILLLEVLRGGIARSTVFF